MKAELYKRLFKAIYTEDIVSLKKIAITIIQEECCFDCSKGSQNKYSFR